MGLQRGAYAGYLVDFFYTPDDWPTGLNSDFKQLLSVFVTQRRHDRNRYIFYLTNQELSEFGINLAY